MVTDTVTSKENIKRKYKKRIILEHLMFMINPIVHLLCALTYFIQIELYGNRTI